MSRLRRGLDLLAAGRYLNPIKYPETWLEQRTKGVGGSDAGTLLGWNSYTSIRQLWLGKLGQGKEFTGNRYADWGNLHEPTILQKYAIDRGVEVLGQDYHGRAMIFRPKGAPIRATKSNCPDLLLLNPLASPVHAFKRANIDGFALDADRRVTIGLEAKTTIAGNRPKWDGKIPLSYLAQCLHCWRVLQDLGRTLQWDIIGLIGGSDFGILRVKHYDWLEFELHERTSRFWAQVVNNDPPTKSMYPRIPDEDGEPMSLIASQGSRGPNILPPAGLIQAVLVDIQDRGMQESEFNGEKKSKHKASFHWMIGTGGNLLTIPSQWEHPITKEVIEVNEKLAGKPYMVSKWFTVSTYAQSAFRPFVESWLGRELSKDEADAFDMETLLGTNAMLTLLNKEKKNDSGEYRCDVSGIAPLMAGFEPLEIPVDYIRFQDRTPDVDESKSGADLSPVAVGVGAKDDDGLPF